MDDQDGEENVLNLEGLCEVVVPLFLAGFVMFFIFFPLQMLADKTDKE